MHKAVVDRIDRIEDLDQACSRIADAIRDRNASLTFWHLDTPHRISASNPEGDLRAWFGDCRWPFVLTCQGPEAEEVFPDLKTAFASALPCRFDEADDSRPLICRAKVTILSKYGMHARPGMAFVECLCRFACRAVIRNMRQRIFLDGREVWLPYHEGLEADGHSIMEVLLVGAAGGTDFEIVFDGTQAKEALSALEDLIPWQFEGSTFEVLEEGVEVSEHAQAPGDNPVR